MYVKLFVLLKKISNKRIKPITIEISPGMIKVIFQLKNFNKKPAINAPDPMPMPPKIPFMPKALPFFLEEFTTHAIPTG